MRRIVFGLVLGAVAAGCSKGGLMGSANKTYTLSLNPKQGQTYSYSLTTGSAAQSVSMDMAMTAQKVEANQITFDTKMSNMTMGGKPIPGVSSTSLLMVMDKQGKPTSITVESGPGAGQQIPVSQASVPTASFPTTPLKVGDTWTQKVQNMDMTYKLASVDEEGGKQVAHLQITGPATGQLKLDGPAEMDVDIDTGMPISVNMSMDAPSGKVTTTMKQTN